MLCGRALWEVRVTGMGCPGHVPWKAVVPVHRAEGTPDRASLPAGSWVLRSLPGWSCLHRAAHPDLETKEITVVHTSRRPRPACSLVSLLLLGTCACVHACVRMCGPEPDRKEGATLARVHWSHVYVHITELCHSHRG